MLKVWYPRDTARTQRYTPDQTRVGCVTAARSRLDDGTHVLDLARNLAITPANTDVTRLSTGRCHHTRARTPRFAVLSQPPAEPPFIEPWAHPEYTKASVQDPAPSRRAVPAGHSTVDEIMSDAEPKELSARLRVRLKGGYGFTKHRGLPRDDLGNESIRAGGR